MSYKRWPKRDPNKNYFLVPNEIFHIGLSYPEISIYCYLLSIEDRETYQCWPSYKTIGKALGMCENTVSKYVRSLEEKGLIRTESTMVRSKDGRPLNGNLRYTICPIQAAVELFYERQFRQLEEDAARQRAAARLAESARESPQNALCAPFGAEASPSAEPGLEAEFGPLSGVLPGTKEKQDKDLASQAPPGRPLLPAVRAVSGVRKLASLTGRKDAVGVSFSPKPHIAGFSQMSDRKQEQLIAKLVKDFPDTKTLYEYGDYQSKPTKAAASAFLTLALESNWDALHQSEQHMKYIATRPRAERLGSHGLFCDSDGVSLEKAMEELEHYTGNVWTHIISLKREDAVRLGFDNASAWRNLIRSHRNEIAAAMKIPPGDFRWYAAFHDEGEHPHIHMMAWSAKPGQAYLSKEGIRQIKSKLTNDIFRNEMLHLYEQKTESRDELVREARRAMLELIQSMREGVCNHPDAEQLMQELAAQLGTVKGKKTYGYLPKRLKRLVDEIIDEMERLPVVRQCYEQWLMLQGKVDSYYHDKPREQLPLSQQKEFRQIKNAVIREAKRLRQGEVTFEERDLDQQDEPDQFRNGSYEYWRLQEIIREEQMTLEERSEAVCELEKLAKCGDRYSQYLLGKLWRDGPLLIPDGVEARYWFEQAAWQGHLVAQYALAKLYLSDDLEVHDTARGVEWLRYAAEGGSSWAMYRLGKELLKDEIMEKDTAGAVDWFTQSAERGNPYAQYMLGKLYLMGKEVPRDKEQADLWLTRSAKQGNEYAQYLLDYMEEGRSPAAMLAVTRLLHHMSRVFQDNSVPKSRPGGIQIDRKRLKKLREKKIALGHKPDDHEEQWPEMTM